MRSVTALPTDASDRGSEAADPETSEWPCRIEERVERSRHRNGHDAVLDQGGDAPNPEEPGKCDVEGEP
jgi:hypothetical protein